MVRKNTQRLQQIVEEILDISRARGTGSGTETLALDAVVAATCGDWTAQTRSAARVQLVPGAPHATVRFDPDHLRRVLVNLLDNALRYASATPGSIIVATDLNLGQARLSVWSDGAPLDPGVQRHLFEPFFSSESRSSGLGLYICRELCDRHGALMTYVRGPAPDGSAREGNNFAVTFRTRTTDAPAAAPFATIRA
jgi:two-component system sensor histidine kinase PilS (NtrC family)